MNDILESPVLLLALFGVLIIFSLPLLLSIKIIHKLSGYFKRLEEELKRIMDQ